MFTGIVEGTGEVVAFAPPDLTLRVPFAVPPVGASVAVNGVCLTVSTRSKGRFTTQAMEETLSRTNLGQLRPGSRVNLERAMAASARLDGHIVQGHVDATAVLQDVEERPNSHLLTLQVPKRYAPYLVDKGSVTLDGISLTVVKARTSGKFTVSIIPLTWEKTNLHTRRPGDRLNFEADIMAKTMARLMAPYITRLEKLLKEGGA